MAALVAIILIDILVMIAVLYYGRKHDAHPVSVTAPSIQALNALITQAEAAKAAEARSEPEAAAEES